MHTLWAGLIWLVVQLAYLAVGVICGYLTAKLVLWLWGITGPKGIDYNRK